MDVRFKPRFASEIRYRGNRVEKIEPVILNPQICTKKTLEAMHDPARGRRGERYGQEPQQDELSKLPEKREPPRSLTRKRGMP